jgi:succinyl-diaminopimelate desuccinylase
MTESDQDVVALLSDLVAIPSVNPAYRAGGDPDAWFGEAAAGAYVADWLRRIGLDVEVDDVEPGRPNVVARLKGRRSGRSLLWEGHLDTVHVAGMTINPFRAAVEGGRLYGRGAVDDKGCLAAFMLALRDLVRDPPGCDITFVAATDEEFGFRGISHHVARGERYDFGVAGEPTELRIVRACKGCVRWTVDVAGRAAHSSRPEEGIDAIAIAADLVRYVMRETAPRFAAIHHPLLGRPTLTCTMMQAGSGPNVVAGQAVLTYDYRVLPPETGVEAWTRVDAITRAFSRSLPAGASVTMRPPFIDSTSMEVPETETVVRVMQAVCRQFGISPRPEGVPYGSDASKMTATGTPTIIFGPGGIAQAHTADEWVEVAQVARAAAMLAAFARRAGSGDA